MNNLMNYLLHGWKWTGASRLDPFSSLWRAQIIHRNPVKMWTDAEGDSP